MNDRTLADADRPPLLEIQNLRIDLKADSGWIHPVKGASFSIPAGGAVALVGESGSGKSIIAQAILGILPHNAHITGGRIPFHDQGKIIDLAALARDGKQFRAIRGSRLGIVFQEPMTALSPLHRISSQIGEVLALQGIDSKRCARETLEMLERVGFPDPARGAASYPFELSGGLRQRAMIAMALISGPALLIADEPTTALDVTLQAQILKLLVELRDQFGMALLMITHDLGVVANIAEHVVVLHQGSVVESGSLDMVLNAPGHPYLQALLRAAPRIGMDRAERLESIRSARTKAEKVPDTGASLSSDDETLLEIQAVSKTYYLHGSATGWMGPKRAVRAVNRLSLEIRRGECFGLVGESGCGKTTLNKMICGAFPPDSGHILLHDQGKTTDLAKLSRVERRNFATRIQLVFQDPFSSLNPRMKIEHIIAEPLLIHKDFDPEQRRARVIELLDMVGLGRLAMGRYPHSFSGGQRQRIAIARALALAPNLLICDEPVSALDVSIQAQILNLLRDLQAELGLTYLFISHNLAVVDYMADRIAVMYAGRIVETASREQLFSDPRHPYTKTLINAVPGMDLDHKLNLSKIFDERTSSPENWPWPFTIRPNDDEMAMIDCGQYHLVRAHEIPGQAG